MLTKQHPGEVLFSFLPFYTQTGDGSLMGKKKNKPSRQVDKPKSSYPTSPPKISVTYE